MPTHPDDPNFTTLLNTLPHLTRTGTHNLLVACQKLKRDWHSLSHTQRLLFLRRAVQRHGPRGTQYLRQKQKAVATGMCLLQLWMYRGLRVGRMGRGRGVVGRKGRRVVARKGERSRMGPAVGSVEAPRTSREGLEQEVQRDGAVVGAATRDAATQTHEATTSSPRSSTAAATPAHSSTTTTTTTSSSSSSTTATILHHQLAHLHAEFSALQHAFFALQAGNVSLRNYVLDQQIRHQIQLNGLRAENRTLQTEKGEKVEGLEGEIVQLRTENARLRGFVMRMRDEAGDLLVMERRDGEDREEGGEDSGIGGEV